MQDGEASKDTPSQVKRAVDEGTYLRHLLLTEPDLRDETPFTVELVLAVAKEEECKREIGTVLRRIIGDTGSLQHLGISLLPLGSGEETVDEGVARSAFPWLLRKTRDWYRSASARVREGVSAAASAPADTHEGLQEITLKDYRLPGTRTLTLQSHADLHLVHGANGSGKSTLVEAMELYLTGRIERLRDAVVHQKTSYLEVIRNRRSEPPSEVTVTLSFADGERSTHHVVKDGLEPAPPATVDSALAWRLDQPAMDRLTSAGDVERADVLLAAFFPEGTPVRKAHAEALDRVKSARESLRGFLEHLEFAEATLKRLGEGWQPRERGQQDVPYNLRLNDWLEHHVLAELAQKQLEIQETLAAAEHKEWRPLDASLAGFLRGAPSESELRAAARVSEQLRELRQKKFADLGSSTVKDVETADTGLVAYVTDREAEALDETGDWVLQAKELKELNEAEDRFGQFLQRSVLTDRKAPLGDLSVGDAGWTDAIRERLHEMRQLCQDQKKVHELPEWLPDQKLHEDERVKTLLASYEALERAEEQLRTQFLAKLSEPRFLEALNELMALFTPARWAYQDVQLNYREDETGGYLLDMDHSDLRLNSAELTVFALALFLLCAFRMDNQLRVIVLDDPLKNMDELTVTVAARGLAKLARVWKEPDISFDRKLIVFLHGTGELDTLRDALPAAVYRIPWLSPAATEAEPLSYRAVEPTRRAETQHLDRFARYRPQEPTNT